MGERKHKPVQCEPCVDCPAILTTNRCPKCREAVCVMCSATKHPCTMPPRPTTKVMVGGETGEDDCGLPVVVYTGGGEPWSAIPWWLADEDGAWSPLDALPGCPAPAPEAP